MSILGISDGSERHATTVVFIPNNLQSEKLAHTLNQVTNIIETIIKRMRIPAVHSSKDQK
jgi:hypothetical protein